MRGGLLGGLPCFVKDGLYFFLLFAAFNPHQPCYPPPPHRPTGVRIWFPTETTKGFDIFFESFSHCFPGVYRLFSLCCPCFFVWFPTIRDSGEGRSIFLEPYEIIGTFDGKNWSYRGFCWVIFFPIKMTMISWVSKEIFLGFRLSPL